MLWEAAGRHGQQARGVQSSDNVVTISKLLTHLQHFHIAALPACRCQTGLYAGARLIRLLTQPLRSEPLLQLPVRLHASSQQTQQQSHLSWTSQLMGTLSFPAGWRVRP